VYGKEDYFLDNYLRDSNKVSCVSMTYYAVNTWFLGVQDYIGCFIAIVNIIAVYFVAVYTDLVSSVLLSLSVLSSYNLTMDMSFIGLNFVRIENQMKLIKSAMEMAEMETEAELETENDPQNWPANGNIKFDKVIMRYKKGARNALDGVSFEVNENQKAGVQGRSGSGKSSVINTLFRLYEISEGTISIDGVDVGEIGLHTLRENISYLPQTPFVMTGTIRQNLDPYMKHSDEVVKEALRDVQLLEYVNTFEKGIYAEMSQSQVLFSMGQKQLL